MADTDFTLDSVEAELGIQQRPGTILPTLPDVVPPAWLEAQLNRGLELALISEKARSECIGAQSCLLSAS